MGSKCSASKQNTLATGGLDPTAPVFAVVLAMTYLYERITPRVALGIALSVGGILPSLA